MADDTMETLRRAKENAEKTISIINGVLNGTDTLSGGCRQLGYGYTTFLYHLRRLAIMDAPDKYQPKLPKYEPTPQEHIYAGVFYLPPEKACEIMPDDAEDALDFVLKDGFTERDKDILCRRAAGETIDTIADVYDISRERVRQIEAKCYRRLRNPARKQLLRVGLPKYTPEAEALPLRQNDAFTQTIDVAGCSRSLCKDCENR